VQCICLCDGSNEYRERLRQARRAVAGGRRGDLNRELFLDGHSSHIYNLDFTELMTANNVDPFMFPAHTTHCLQPTDKWFFKSFKNNWTNEGIEAVRRTGGSSLGKHRFFSVFTPAWTKCCSVETAQSGLRATGIFPLNCDIIPDSAYAPSETSERVERPSETSEVGSKNDHLGLTN